VHGQYEDLLRIFNQLGFPPMTNYLMLGDYVDRGPFNLETICLLLTLKVKYPGNIFLLRGNHETSVFTLLKASTNLLHLFSSATNAVYGFKDEVVRRYNSLRLWEVFNACFAQMPVSALIGDRILCMHGGLSPLLRERNQLRRLRRGWLDPANNSLEMDLLW
jgi:hypothetical protein